MNDIPAQAHEPSAKGTQAHKEEHSPNLVEPSVNIHIEYAVEWRNKKTGTWNNVTGWSKKLPDSDILKGQTWGRVVYRYVTEPQVL